jgi:hypothetical protein
MVADQGDDIQEDSRNWRPGGADIGRFGKYGNQGE